MVRNRNIKAIPRVPNRANGLGSQFKVWKLLKTTKANSNSPSATVKVAIIPGLNTGLAFVVDGILAEAPHVPPKAQ